MVRLPVQVAEELAREVAVRHGTMSGVAADLIAQGLQRRGSPRGNRSVSK